MYGLASCHEMPCLVTEVYERLRMNSALLWQKEVTDKSPKSEKVWLDLAYSTSIPNLEQKHSSCWKIFKSRHNDIALMSMCITDTFCSSMRNVIFKSCFFLSEYGWIYLPNVRSETTFSDKLITGTYKSTSNLVSLEAVSRINSVSVLNTETVKMPRKQFTMTWRFWKVRKTFITPEHSGLKFW